MTGYTAKVGLRKPPKPLTLAECMAIAQKHLSWPPIIGLNHVLDHMRREALRQCTEERLHQHNFPDRIVVHGGAL